MANRSPKVSIGMPVYNGEKYIEEAIDSILSQTFEDFELIICDNASIDDTREICRAYAHNDDRVQYVLNEKNLGAAGNYNRTLELATAPYFRWACDDDVLKPTNLERCVEVLDRRSNVVLVAPRTLAVDGEGMEWPSQEWLRRLDLQSSLPSERFAEFLQAYSWLGCGSQLFGLMRTDILRKTGGLGNYVSSDIVLIGEMSLRGKFAEVDEVLFLKRVHEGDSVNGNDFEVDKMTEFIDPESKGKTQWLEFRWVSEFMKTVGRVPMSSTERRACYRKFLRQYVKPHAPKILKELAVISVEKLTLGKHRPVQRALGFNTMYEF